LESVCKKRCAARHGPRVWELDGPTPILKISNTDMGSYDKKFDLKQNYNIIALNRGTAKGH